MADYRSVDHQPRFGVFSGFAYTINSVVGAGFLAIPWAYQHGGWGISLAMQVLFLLVGWLLGRQLLEITSRVTVLSARRMSQPVSFCKVLKLAFGLERLDTYYCPSSPTESQPDIRDGLQFDIYEIVKLLLGRCWAGVYFLCSTVYLLFCLSAYINIFGTGFATHIPVFEECQYKETEEISDNCRWQYVLFISVFFVLMAYFSSLEFQEQLLMQVTMTLMRLFVILTVVIISLLDLTQEKNLDNDKEYQRSDPPAISFKDIGQTMPIVLFAGIYHPYFPGILSVIKKEPKKLNKILACVTISLIILYCSLGMSAAFGIPHVSTNVSLSFAKFTDGYSPEARPAWTSVIRYLIVLFPSLDVISVFPLLAHAISDSILSVLYSADRLVVRFTTKLIYYSIRVGSIVPAFVYAFFEVQLGHIANNSGLIGFYLTFFIIPLLHIAARYTVSGPSAYDIKCPLWISAGITLISVPLFLLNMYSVFADRLR